MAADEINWTIEAMRIAPTAIIGLAIGGATVYIAWRQWRTAETRVVLDLFDRRLSVYKAFDAVIHSLFDEDKGYYVPDDALPELENVIAEATFLFGDEVIGFMGKVHQTLNRSYYVDTVAPRTPDPIAWRKVADEALFDCAETATATLAALVRPYMRITKKSDSPDAHAAKGEGGSKV